MPDTPRGSAARTLPDGVWIVNVASPFPRERRDRNYGPFATKVDADAFAEGLPWRAEVRPVFAPELVRSP